MAPQDPVSVIISMPQARNFAFIDANNLHLGIRNQGWTLDYRKFRIYLSEKYFVIRAYMFMGYIPERTELYTLLESWGYVLIFKPILRDSKGMIKGNCDAEMVLQAMIDFHHYNQALVISGDGDFACLVRHLLNNSKLCCVLAPDAGHCSILLKDAAQKMFASLGGLRSKLEYMKRTPVGRNREGDFS